MVAKTYWLAGSALALLVAAGPAMAADLPVAPVYKAPPPMIAPLNWTGFYLGAGSGFAVFNADTSVQNPAGAPLFATSTQGGKGWLQQATLATITHSATTLSPVCSGTSTLAA